MSSMEKTLLYLFELPNNPISFPRCGGKVQFQLENDASVVKTRFGDGDVNVISVPERPDATPDKLGRATSVPLGKSFCFFLESHRLAAKDLCDVFMKCQGAEDLMQVAARVKGCVNETLFVYALSYVILHKKELRSVRLPTILEVFPHKFIRQEELMKTLRQSTASNQKGPMEVNIKVESSVFPEQSLAYWREDYGINGHHWHWHGVYSPTFTMDEDGQKRKGELFYYMHQQMIARYDMERLSLGLRQVEALDNWRAPIDHGYFPNIAINDYGTLYGSRQDGTLMQEGNAWEMMENWRSRLLDAIHQGFMIKPDGEQVSLSDDETEGKRGIEILGDTLEPDFLLSVNTSEYGSLHNMGHGLIASSNDPNGAHREEMGVMGDTATAMRDPVFYRWHKFIDDMFQEYKLTQRPYTKDELLLAGVSIDRVSIVRNNETDILHTGWNTREFEASRGLDFGGRVVKVRLEHLDHEPFSYDLKVTNNGITPKEVTVRVFLAPKFNSSEKEMTFMEQRLLWAEMDKFTVLLKPGENHVVRSSKDSSITNPEELTFKQLEDNNRGPSEAYNFCACGWPQHMLLPRGRPEGMTFQMFFMLTDYAIDKVEDPKKRECANAVSFCGILDSKFPDSRPMGFPFDRRPPPTLFGKPVDMAADYARLDNAFLHDITIKFLADELKLGRDSN